MRMYPLNLLNQTHRLFQKLQWHTKIHAAALSFLPFMHFHPFMHLYFNKPCWKYCLSYFLMLHWSNAVALGIIQIICVICW